MTSEENNNVAVEFVRHVLNNLVEYPESIVIDLTLDDIGVLINLQSHKDDMGRIIGKNGQTIKSIRTLLRVIGKKANQRINLKILEPAE